MDEYMILFEQPSGYGITAQDMYHDIMNLEHKEDMVCNRSIINVILHAPGKEPVLQEFTSMWRNFTRFQLCEMVCRAMNRYLDQDDAPVNIVALVLVNINDLTYSVVIGQQPQ